MICRFCGAEISDDSLFCGYCGEKLVTDEEPEEAANPEAAEDVTEAGEAEEKAIPAEPEEAANPEAEPESDEPEEAEEEPESDEPEEEPVEEVEEPEDDEPEEAEEEPEPDEHEEAVEEQGLDMPENADEEPTVEEPETSEEVASESESETFEEAVEEPEPEEAADEPEPFVEFDWNASPKDIEDTSEYLWNPPPKEAEEPKKDEAVEEPTVVIAPEPDVENPAKPEEPDEQPGLKQATYFIPEAETIAVNATDSNFWSAFEMMEPKAEDREESAKKSAALDWGATQTVFAEAAEKKGAEEPAVEDAEPASEPEPVKAVEPEPVFVSEPAVEETPAEDVAPIFNPAAEETPIKETEPAAEEAMDAEEPETEEPEVKDEPVIREPIEDEPADEDLEGFDWYATRKSDEDRDEPAAADEAEPVIEAAAEEEASEEFAGEKADDLAGAEVAEEKPIEPTDEESIEPTDEESIEPAEEEQEEVLLDKIGGWLGALGKSVHTGLGWAGSAAREKAKDKYNEFKENRKFQEPEEPDDFFAPPETPEETAKESVNFNRANTADYTEPIGAALAEAEPEDGIKEDGTESTESLNDIDEPSFGQEAEPEEKPEQTDDSAAEAEKTSDLIDEASEVTEAEPTEPRPVFGEETRVDTEGEGTTSEEPAWNPEESEWIEEEPIQTLSDRASALIGALAGAVQKGTEKAVGTAKEKVSEIKENRASKEADEPAEEPAEESAELTEQIEEPADEREAIDAFAAEHEIDAEPETSDEPPEATAEEDLTESADEAEPIDEAAAEEETEAEAEEKPEPETEPEPEKTSDEDAIEPEPEPATESEQTEEPDSEPAEFHDDMQDELGLVDSEAEKSGEAGEAEAGESESSESEEKPLAKAGAWFGSLGQSMRKGTDKAVSKAKGRVSEIREEHSSERGAWTAEEEGEVTQDTGFWYRSLRPEEELEKERLEKEAEENERRAARARAEQSAAAARAAAGSADENGTGGAGKKPDAGRDADDRDELRGDDNKLSKTKVLGQDYEEEDLKPIEDDESTGAKKKSSSSRKADNSSRGLKIGILVVLIVAVLAGGALVGTKTHKEHSEAEKYQNAVTQAQQYAETKDFENAEASYKALIEAYPDRAELYEGLANVYIDEKKYDDAINTVNEGVAQTGKSKTFTALSEDLKALTSIEWREPFRRVLADNEWAVRRYDDINDCCVALCDVNGDKWPEMFFFTQEYYGYGILHIYTYDYNTGGAKEIKYDFPNRSTQYQDAFYDIENDNAGFIIYKKKSGNGFGISSSFKKGSDAWQTTGEYTVNGMDCNMDSLIEACVTATYRVSDDDKDNGKAKYLQNEKKVGYNTYIGEFKRVMDDIDEVMFSKQGAGGDKEIWSRTVDMDDLSMTYDGAMKILDEDAQ
ncbi:MAG: zinc-ribbon domain-containing protein [Firmicutes bacterium]|nr:zinc-ribbon domain-containing protein [Bacillota bacterium]